MKEKCMQLQKITEEISDQHKGANILIMIEHNGSCFTQVDGRSHEIGAGLVQMMREAPGLDKAFRVALDFYDETKQSS